MNDIVLHKPLEGPMEYRLDTGEEVYIVVYLAEAEGKHYYEELIYDTLSEAYADVNKVNSNIEGLRISEEEHPELKDE